MAADEEAAIASVIAAIFLVNKEEEENRDFGFAECFGSPIYKGEETHPSNHGLCRECCSRISVICLQGELSPVPKYI